MTTAALVEGVQPGVDPGEGTAAEAVRSDAAQRLAVMHEAFGIPIPRDFAPRATVKRAAFEEALWFDTARPTGTAVPTLEAQWQALEAYVLSGPPAGLTPTDPDGYSRESGLGLGARVASSAPIVAGPVLGPIDPDGFSREGRLSSPEAVTTPRIGGLTFAELAEAIFVR